MGGVGWNLVGRDGGVVFFLEVYCEGRREVGEGIFVCFRFGGFK